MESDEKYLYRERWRAFLTGDESLIPEEFQTQVLMEKLTQSVFGLLPANPRCIDCNAPFHGAGGAFVKVLGFRESELTPKLCNHCDAWIRKHEVGAEVDLAILFADVRGSSALAKSMSTAAFQQLINRFYDTASDVLVASDALIDKLIGDEVTAFYVPGIAGPDYARHALDAAVDILRVTGHSEEDGPWVPVGAGLHAGTAYVGVVGSMKGISNITVLGDVPNTAASFASQAEAGEVIISEEAVHKAGLDPSKLEKRQLSVKGRTEPISVRVLHLSPM